MQLPAHVHVLEPSFQPHTLVTTKPWNRCPSWPSQEIFLNLLGSLSLICPENLMWVVCVFISFQCMCDITRLGFGTKFRVGNSSHFYSMNTAVSMINSVFIASYILNFLLSFLPSPSFLPSFLSSILLPSILVAWSTMNAWGPFHF